MAEIEINEQDYLAVLQHVDTLKYHGAYYMYKPTPSGCARYILRASTTEGFDTELLAALAIEAAFPEMKKISTDLNS